MPKAIALLNSQRRDGTSYMLMVSVSSSTLLKNKRNPIFTISLIHR